MSTKLYRVYSFGDLAESKNIFKIRDEVSKHLANVIAITEGFRKSLPEQELKLSGWKEDVSEKEILENFTVHFIDTKLLPGYKKLFPTSVQTSTKNLKKYIKEVLEDERKHKERAEKKKKKDEEEYATEKNKLAHGSEGNQSTPDLQEQSEVDVEESIFKTS